MKATRTEPKLIQEREEQQRRADGKQALNDLKIAAQRVLDLSLPTNRNLGDVIESVGPDGAIAICDIVHYHRLAGRLKFVLLIRRKGNG